MRRCAQLRALEAITLEYATFFKIPFGELFQLSRDRYTDVLSTELHAQATSLAASISRPIGSGLKQDSGFRIQDSGTGYAAANFAKAFSHLPYFFPSFGAPLSLPFENLLVMMKSQSLELLSEGLMIPGRMPPPARKRSPMSRLAAYSISASPMLTASRNRNGSWASLSWNLPSGP
jgi:hypothetical protein